MRMRNTISAASSRKAFLAEGSSAGCALVDLAAEKGHLYAQARLGQMLFNGDGVPWQAPRGLMWMQLAAEKADPERDGWVLELSTRARDGATEDERRLSETDLRKQERAQR